MAFPLTHFPYGRFPFTSIKTSKKKLRHSILSMETVYSLLRPSWIISRLIWREKAYILSSTDGILASCSFLVHISTFFLMKVHYSSAINHPYSLTHSSIAIRTRYGSHHSRDFITYPCLSYIPSHRGSVENDFGRSGTEILEEDGVCKRTESWESKIGRKQFIF